MIVTGDINVVIEWDSMVESAVEFVVALCDGKGNSVDACGGSETKAQKNPVVISASSLNVPNEDVFVTSKTINMSLSNLLDEVKVILFLCLCLDGSDFSKTSEIRTTVKSAEVSLADKADPTLQGGHTGVIIASFERQTDTQFEYQYLGKTGKQEQFMMVLNKKKKPKKKAKKAGASHSRTPSQTSNLTADTVDTVSSASSVLVPTVPAPGRRPKPKAVAQAPPPTSSPPPPQRPPPPTTEAHRKDQPLPKQAGPEEASRSRTPSPPPSPPPKPSLPATAQQHQHDKGTTNKGPPGATQDNEQPRRSYTPEDDLEDILGPEEPAQTNRDTDVISPTISDDFSPRPYTHYQHHHQATAAIATPPPPPPVASPLTPVVAREQPYTPTTSEKAAGGGQATPTISHVPDPTQNHSSPTGSIAPPKGHPPPPPHQPPQSPNYPPQQIIEVLPPSSAATQRTILDNQTPSPVSPTAVIPEQVALERAILPPAATVAIITGGGGQEHGSNSNSTSTSTSAYVQHPVGGIIRDDGVGDEASLQERVDTLDNILLGAKESMHLLEEYIDKATDTLQTSYGEHLHDIQSTYKGSSNTKTAELDKREDTLAIIGKMLMMSSLKTFGPRHSTILQGYNGNSNFEWIMDDEFKGKHSNMLNTHNLYIGTPFSEQGALLPLTERHNINPCVSPTCFGDILQLFGSDLITVFSYFGRLPFDAHYGLTKSDYERYSPPTHQRNHGHGGRGHRQHHHRQRSRSASPTNSISHTQSRIMTLLSMECSNEAIYLSYPQFVELVHQCNVPFVGSIAAFWVDSLNNHYYDAHDDIVYTLHHTITIQQFIKLLQILSQEVYSIYVDMVSKYHTLYLLLLNYIQPFVKLLKANNSHTDPFQQCW